MAGIVDEPTIPTNSTTFSHGELGCHAGTVVVVAWAPRMDPGAQDTFNPQTGDLLALSDIAADRIAARERNRTTSS